MSDVRITVADIADPSSFVCDRAQFWFRKHGLDWEAFKREGITVAELMATGDQTDLIKRCERTARRRLGLEVNE